MIDKYEVGARACIYLVANHPSALAHRLAVLPLLFPRLYPAPCVLRLDGHQVSNEEYREFVQSTGYRTESEAFGWSFVFESAVPPQLKVPWPRDCV